MPRFFSPLPRDGPKPGLADCRTMAQHHGGMTGAQTQELLTGSVGSPLSRTIPQSYSSKRPLRLDKRRQIQVTIVAMHRGEVGAAAETRRPVTSDIHAALCIIPAAARELTPALPPAGAPARRLRTGWFNFLYREGAMPACHRVLLGVALSSVPGGALPVPKPQSLQLRLRLSRTFLILL